MQRFAEVGRELADIGRVWPRIAELGRSLRGFAEVCKAALKLIGITDADLAKGYYCDPNTKSDLGIVARPGIVIRLSRYFDKQLGFVNGVLVMPYSPLD